MPSFQETSEKNSLFFADGWESQPFIHKPISVPKLSVFPKCYMDEEVCLQKSRTGRAGMSEYF